MSALSALAAVAVVVIACAFTLGIAVIFTAAGWALRGAVEHDRTEARIGALVSAGKQGYPTPRQVWRPVQPSEQPTRIGLPMPSPSDAEA